MTINGALSDLNNLLKADDIPIYYKSSIKAVMDTIALSKPQEPKTGHWIKSNIGGAKVCSVCNAHMGLSSFKFCPNCGVDMRGGE